MSARKLCKVCGMAPRVTGIDECPACRIKANYRHVHKVLRLARCGHMDRSEALDDAKVVRAEVRWLRGAA